MLYLHENEISRKWNKGTKNIVSICCITYNHEKYIERAIDGFLLQDTDFPFEIVIGNDCSTDRTTQILNSYEAMYPNIVKVIHNKKNIGMMKNFLQTLHACSGEYIAVCEGDDYWINRNKLRININKALENPDIDFFVHPAFIETSGKIKGVTRRKTDGFFSIDDILKTPNQFAPTSSYFAKRNVVDRLPYWLEDAPIGDFFFEVYATYTGKGLYLSKAMSVYRMSVDNSWSALMRNKKSSKKNLIYVEDMMICLDKIAKEIPISKQSIDRKRAALLTARSLAFIRLHRYYDFKRAIEESKKHGQISLIQRLLFGCRRVRGLVVLIVVALDLWIKKRTK